MGLAESNGSLPPAGFDSRHLEADCQDQPGSAPEPTLGNRVWATFTFLPQNPKKTVVISVIADKKNAGHLQQQQMRTDLNHMM